MTFLTIASLVWCFFLWCRLNRIEAYNEYLEEEIDLLIENMEQRRVTNEQNS